MGKIQQPFLYHVSLALLLDDSVGIDCQRAQVNNVKCNTDIKVKVGGGVVGRQV
jgi:hypothetical protein